MRGKHPLSLPSKQYSEWHETQSYMLMKYRVPTPIVRCSIVMTFFMPDKRRTDLINKSESVLDLLVDNKIIADDDWLCVNSLHLMSGGVDKDNPGVEIVITELEVIDS